MRQLTYDHDTSNAPVPSNTSSAGSIRKGKNRLGYRLVSKVKGRIDPYSSEYATQVSNRKRNHTAPRIGKLYIFVNRRLGSTRQPLRGLMTPNRYSAASPGMIPMAHMYKERLQVPILLFRSRFFSFWNTYQPKVKPQYLS